MVKFDKKQTIKLRFIASLCLFLLFVSFVQGATKEELEAKISEQNKSIASLNSEIASYQKELESLAKSKDTLANAIKTLTLESKKIDANIKVTESKISSANLKIESLGGSITKTSDRISYLRKGIAKGIKDMNENEQVTFSEMLISNNSLSKLWIEEREQESIFSAIKEKRIELSTEKTALESDKKEVEKLRSELQGLKSDLKYQKDVNKRTQSEKNSLLSATKNQESNYQKLVNQKLALKKQMEADLAKFEDELTYVLKPGLLPKAGSHPLAWPLDYIYITQNFGVSKSAKRLYVTGSHNGVDFRASTGTPVMAMANGIVIDSGNTDLTCKGASYGNWILIKYNNGLSSVYGHLSLIRASNGTVVRTGDVVAYSGGTGYATGPHLHVSVFPNDAVKVASFPSTSCKGKIYTMPVAASNAYLDPILYLP